MTPFTKGRSKLTAREEKRAVSRVRVEREESKMAKVTETGACWGAGAGWEGGVSLCSGNDNEG